jgi:hypothetical protein
MPAVASAPDGGEAWQGRNQHVGPCSARPGPNAVRPYIHRPNVCQSNKHLRYCIVRPPQRLSRQPAEKNMKPLSRKKKILGFVALTILVLLLAPFAVVQIQERIFRHRAEQLLADMRSLMTHKASLAEIQAVFRRRNPDGNPQGDPCRDQTCILEDISSRGFSWIPRYDPNSRKTDWWDIWMSLYRLYGGRNALVIARGSVERWGTSIMYAVSVEGASRPAEGTPHLIGEVVSGARASMRNAWKGLTLHADYVIDKVNPGYDLPTEVMYAHFGEHADPADITRMMTFELSCLTSFLPCRDPGDLMPGAAAQFMREQPRLAQARKVHVCTPYVVGLMARDAGYAGIVEVTGSKTVHLFREGDSPIATVREIENFDPVGDWKTGESRDLEILDANTGHVVPSLPPEVHSGNRLIILADTQFGPVTERCGILPLNPANLELVKQGMAGNLPSAKH